MGVRMGKEAWGFNLIVLGLPAEVPVWAAVFFGDEGGGAGRGVGGEGIVGVPGLAEGLAEGGQRDLEVGEEVLVGAVGAVGGLSGGWGQALIDPGQVKVDEEGAMEEEGVGEASLGVAGDFAVMEGEVGIALALDWEVGDEFDGLGDAGEDIVIGAGDGGEGGVAVEAEDEGVAEGAWGLDDGAAAAGAAEDGDVEGLAGGEVGFEGGLVGVAEDDHGGGGFPEAEDFGALVGVAVFEEGFFEGEVFGGGGEGKVEVFH